MRFTRFIPFVILTLVGLVLFASPGEETAAAQGANLLVNPSFEGQYNSYTPETPQESADCPHGLCTTAQMPAGWKPWWVKERPTDVNPEYKPAEFSDRVRSGSRAAQYFSFWTTHKAGLRQTVTVPENATVTFSIWGTSWITEQDNSTVSDGAATPNMRIGIDPTGGTNIYSEAIVWSGFQQTKDVYGLFTVEAQAQGTQVTVFTFAAPDVNPNSPEFGFKHTDIYWDDASLTTSEAAPAPVSVPSGGGGATNTGAAAANPNPFVLPPTSTPDAEGVIYSVVQAGDSVWSIAAKAGITLEEIRELNNLAEGAFVSVGDRLIVGYGDPPGAEEPIEEPAEAEESQPEATPTPESVTTTQAAETAEEETSSASLCLSAYTDENQNGVRDEGEPLRSAVAFTISDVEKVVSNYVTDGASEPFCIEGLSPGNYQITRSISSGEVATNESAQSMALAAGESVTVEFGSYIDGSAIAQANASSEADGSTASNNLSGSAVGAEDDSGGISTLFIIAVVIAILLLVGVLVIILTARKATV